MTLDVIVPVYGQAELTLACVRSALAARTLNNVEYRLLVIDDASPDPALRAALGALAPDQITVMRHEKNLGFLAAANTGLAASSHDVILLNSDTEVHGNFADRLIAAAYRGRKTATVTPLTNFGSIAAYPEPSRANELPHGWTAAALDDLARRVNDGLEVEIPTGVGFCMFLRRDCLDEVGILDPAFGRGYGEEVDWCLRAAARGWRHVLASDVFVWHQGGASFGAERDERIAASRKMLHDRWPSFRRTVRSFTARDPARPARHRLTAARMAEDSRPVVLRVTHAGGGGVQHHIRDLATLCEPWAESLELLPGSRNHLILRSPLTPAGLSLRTGRSTDVRRLSQMLLALGVTRIHIHHLMGHGPTTSELIRTLGVPIDLTLHDYFFLAPQAHLVDRAGRFAGEPDDATAAEQALLSNSEAPAAGSRLSEWRQRWAWLFEQADRVIAQSSDCAARYRRYFLRPLELAQPPLTPRLDGLVTPRFVDDAPLRVLAIGALSREKGADLLEAAAKQARAAGLPLEFHLAGYAYRQLHEAVKTHGRYKRDDLNSLVAAIDPHVVWYPIQWPETWLQTLTPALELGLPAVVADIGAAPERVDGRPWTWTMPWDSSPDEAVAFLLEVRESIRTGSPPDPPRLKGPAEAVRSDFYPSDYLAPALTARPAGTPLGEQDQATVAELTRRPPSALEHGVRAGFIQASRKLLRSRFARLARRIPPYHVESLRRAILSDQRSSHDSDF